MTFKQRQLGDFTAADGTQKILVEIDLESLPVTTSGGKSIQYIAKPSTNSIAAFFKAHKRDILESSVFRKLTHARKQHDEARSSAEPFGVREEEAAISTRRNDLKKRLGRETGEAADKIAKDLHDVEATTRKEFSTKREAASARTLFLRESSVPLAVDWLTDCLKAANADLSAAKAANSGIASEFFIPALIAAGIAHSLEEAIKNHPGNASLSDIWPLAGDIIDL